MLSQLTVSHQFFRQDTIGFGVKVAETSTDSGELMTRAPVPLEGMLWHFVKLETTCWHPLYNVSPMQVRWTIHV